MNPYILPKIIPNKKTGQSVSASTRANRFNVNFSLGDMGVPAADAEVLVQDALNRLVEEIRQLWSKSKNAGGEALDPRPPKVRGAIIYNRRDWKTFAKHENEVLNGTYRIGKKRKKMTEKDRAYIDKQKEFAKVTKKDYVWQGKTYRPDPNRPTGTWSGLLRDSLTANKVVIRAKNGKIPTRVAARITVAPSRGDIVVKKKMNYMTTSSTSFQNTKNYMGDALDKTSQFKSYKDTTNLTAARLIAIYNNYKRGKMMYAKIMSTAARFI